MLVRMSRGPVDENKERVREECDPFEAALRRDLASTPVVAYESTIGGWTKRAFDIAVTTLTSPAWLVFMLIAGTAAKLRHRERVIYSDERIGYGGNPFQCLHLRLDPSVDALVSQAAQDKAPANDLEAISQRAEGRRVKWRRAIERLPQLFNVLRGDMSLVGPAPLAHADVEPLKTAKRYYLSARPGVIGVKGLVGESQEHATQYKVYSLCWSLLTDMRLLMAACVSTRGELRKPERGEVQIPQIDDSAARRRARAEGRIGV